MEENIKVFVRVRPASALAKSPEIVKFPKNFPNSQHQKLKIAPAFPGQTDPVSARALRQLSRLRVLGAQQLTIAEHSRVLLRLRVRPAYNAAVSLRNVNKSLHPRDFPGLQPHNPRVRTDRHRENLHHGGNLGEPGPAASHCARNLRVLARFLGESLCSPDLQREHPRSFVGEA